MKILSYKDLPIRTLVLPGDMALRKKSDNAIALACLLYTSDAADD